MHAARSRAKRPEVRGRCGSQRGAQDAGIDIHITDVYKYLAEVGKRAPRSMQEVGIFSHS
jgi:hypothetical protein